MQIGIQNKMNKPDDSKKCISSFEPDDSKKCISSFEVLDFDLLYNRSNYSPLFWITFSDALVLSVINRFYHIPLLTGSLNNLLSKFSFNRYDQN